MQPLTTAEIREKYLRYFEDKGCQRWPSSSLIPDDPSLLLTSAGMVQFKPYFLQQKHLPKPFIGTTTAQKCVRTNDIDVIGTDGRHLSFFEMMGNFSFGEYFKKEMCAWALDFSVNELGLPFEKLYFTVFEDDDETIEIWKSLGVADDHISRLGEDDNFWRAGPTGPCGPCSELYYDQGPEVGCGRPECAPGCDCDRFLEYWNCVFTQYDGQEDGTLLPLPKKNIDTGMGLERIAAILQGVQSNFDTDVLHGLIEVGERLSGATYGKDYETDKALRIMADHARSVTFMIGDGILPSNEGRGYVLRRLLRRAHLKGNILGIQGAFLGEFVEQIIRIMGDAYPELVENRELILRAVQSEEERFSATLKQGRSYLDEALAKLEGTVVSGKTAFILHDTYGFPVELTEEIAAERNLTVDLDEFAHEMELQRERARKATQDDAEAAWSTYDGTMSGIKERVGTSEFLGYSQTEADSHVVALLVSGKEASEIAPGMEGSVILDQTPFYAERGGQVGDTGTLSADGLMVEVLDTQSPEADLIVHQVRVAADSRALHVGDVVHAHIDELRRARIKRNHSATHLLHAALRQVLGDHVKQAGSLVAPDRLRFDFTHFEALTSEQIHQIEQVCNDAIMQAHPVNTFITSLTEAREMGVMALFGEKYGEEVRVVDMDGVSMELCGGTHVSNTAEIGLLKITSEQSVGANVRRVEAVTSFDALAYLNTFEQTLKAAAGALHCKPLEVHTRVEGIVEQVKTLKSDAARAAKAQAERSIADEIETHTIQTKAGYPAVILRVDGMDAGSMRNTWDIVRSRMQTPGACVLAGDNNGSPLILAAATDEAVAAGFNAKDMIKAISSHIKGGGGGKPTMAQAGGKDVAGIDAALEAARALLTE